MAMNFVSGSMKTAHQLYEAFGLEPKFIKSFTLHIDVDSVVWAEVVCFVEAESIENATESIKRYHLRLIESAPAKQGGI